MQPSTGTKRQKSYERPTLKKLASEEAEKFLVHHANLGDQGAKEILAGSSNRQSFGVIASDIEGEVGGAASG
jgi:hypothetical protein